MKKINSAIAIAGLVLWLGSSTASWGWRSQPIQNVIDAPVTSTAPISVAKVKTSILVAGTELGWKMADISPGVIQGTLNLRKHTAVVDITYTSTKYSIVYKSSINLDEKDGQIHKNYNSWVQNLSRKIGAEILRQQ